MLYQAMGDYASLSAGGINYNSLKAMKAMDMLKELEERFPVGQ
jgi:hypothetical protein